MKRITHPSRLALALTMVITAALCCPPVTNDALASSMVRMDLETLSARADRIVLGRVEKMESHFVAPGSRRIVTDVTLIAERSLLGDAASSRFVVRRLGGEVGKLGQVVYGEASYRVGERVMLFAAERQGAFFAVGMAQGVMQVYDDGGVARVKVPRAEAVLAGPAQAASLDERKLDDVLALVRVFVARRAEK